MRSGAGGRSEVAKGIECSAGLLDKQAEFQGIDAEAVSPEGDGVAVEGDVLSECGAVGGALAAVVATGVVEECGEKLGSGERAEELARCGADDPAVRRNNKDLFAPAFGWNIRDHCFEPSVGFNP